MSKTASRWLAACACVGMLGCSRPAGISARDAADANDTGGTLAAKSASERAILRELPTLSSQARHHVGGVAIMADAPYASASGRTCRALHVSSGGPHDEGRLACTDGKVWFFVPDVFAGGSVDAGN